MKISRTIASLLLALLACTFPGAAQAKSWRVADFQDNITVERDGSAVVAERITLVFVGEWHGIHRTIPIEYPGPNGTNYELFLAVTSVTDGNGGKLKYDSSTAHGSRDLKIYIPDAVDATRTVEITYRVRNGTRFFDSHDEFYWNVTGNDWPVPIDHAAATVRFPDSAAGSLRAQAFTGVYGSTQHDATSSVEGAETRFETSNPLPMRGGLTIDVYLPKDILQEPGALTKFFWFVGGNPIVFLPLVTLAGMFTLWWYKGRDPDPGVSVAPMYEPPFGISPAEAGTLLDDNIHPRDITSTIIDLAVRGYIKIEETAEKVLIFTHKDYVFHLLKPREQWGADLAPHERVMLENVFAAGTDTPPLQPQEPLLHGGSRDPPGHHGGIEEEGSLPARPGVGQRIQRGRGGCDSCAVCRFPVSGLGELFQLCAVTGGVLAAFSGDLVAVCARDDRQDLEGIADSRRGARVSGVYEPRGCGAAQGHASDDVRKVSALRDGAGRGAPLGAGVCRDRQRSAAVVCGAGRLRYRLQSDFLFEFHAQHGRRYAPGLRVSAARKLERLRLWWRRIGGGGGFSGGGFGGGGGGAF